MSDLLDPSDGPASAKGQGDLPSARLLRAVECLAAHGPLTLDSLRQRIDVSKTAAWRIVAALREAGWVRSVHGGRFLQLDARLDDLFATAAYSDREFSGVSDRLALLGRDLPVYVDLFALGPQTDPVLIETTRRLTATGNGVDDPDEAVSRAIEAAMTGAQLNRHLLRLAETAPPEQAKLIRSGAEQRRIRSLNGFVWSLDGSALAVSMRGRLGTPAALRLVSRDRKEARAQIAATLRQLREALAAEVEGFGPGDRDKT